MYDAGHVEGAGGITGGKPMGKKLLIVLGVLVVLLGGFAVVVAMQPSHFRVQRTGRITAPPEKVFPHVNNLRNWDAWSPWAKLDPNAKVTFEGPESGTGSVFRWSSGQHDVGVGSMTITESKPHELVRIRLEFIEPFEGVNQTEFTFKPEGEQTVVTWVNEGEMNFIGKAICMFNDMDSMLGGMFEKGLANMKAVVEGSR